MKLFFWYFNHLGKINGLLKVLVFVKMESYSKIFSFSVLSKWVIYKSWNIPIWDRDVTKKVSHLWVWWDKNNFVQKAHLGTFTVRNFQPNGNMQNGGKVSFKNAHKLIGFSNLRHQRSVFFLEKINYIISW